MRMAASSAPAARAATPAIRMPAPQLRHSRRVLMTDALDELGAQLGSDKVTTSPTVLHSHGRDENFPEVRPPLAVAYAEQVEDVQTVLGWCRAHGIPLIPFGAGTSLEGALVPADPAAPGISLDLSRMNQVLSIQPENFQAVVQPGVTRTALNT